MNRRLELQTILEKIVGNKNVYFQPPASIRIAYPCVMYHVGAGNVKRADGMVYGYTHSYDMVFIYKNPNIDIIEQVLNVFPMCRFTRSYIADNLNHYAFTLYY